MRLYCGSIDHIAGTQDDEIKVTITAPPVAGQANSHLIRFLAKKFGVVKAVSCWKKRNWGTINSSGQLRIDQSRQIPSPLNV